MLDNSIQLSVFLPNGVSGFRYSNDPTFGPFSFFMQDIALHTLTHGPEFLWNTAGRGYRTPHHFTSS